MQTQFFTLLCAAFLTISCGTTNNKNQTIIDAPTITGTSWKLTTLEGKVIDSAPDRQEQDIHFVLREDGKVTGFTGCNTFNGSYTLEKGNRIRFSKMASTRMACPDATIKEFDYLQVFELADNYTINGDQLMLNVGRRAPLAVFEVVDL